MAESAAVSSGESWMKRSKKKVTAITRRQSGLGMGPAKSVMKGAGNPVHQFERDLGKTPANYVPLTPLSFLPRAAHVFPRHIAIIHGSLRQTWAQTYTRCRQLASALRKAGIRKGDTVALMAPNIPAAYEAAFGVPMAGA